MSTLELLSFENRHPFLFYKAHMLYIFFVLPFKKSVGCLLKFIAIATTPCLEVQTGIFCCKASLALLKYYFSEPTNSQQLLKLLHAFWEAQVFIVLPNLAMPIRMQLKQDVLWLRHQLSSIFFGWQGAVIVCFSRGATIMSRSHVIDVIHQLISSTVLGFSVMLSIWHKSEKGFWICKKT